MTPPFPLGDEAVRTLVRYALQEDAAWDDATSRAVVPAGHRLAGRIVARADGVVCGLRLATEAFRMLDDRVHVAAQLADGASVAPGATLLDVDGPAAPILSAERTALNFLQRLSGVATLTRRYVDAVAGTDAAIVDTRKTTPGWRLLEKYAVRCGGGANHRLHLGDAVLIKDNHLAAIGGDIATAVTRARAAAHDAIVVQVECDTLDQVSAAAAAGADAILCDNMDLAMLAEAVRIVGGRCLTEASGGVTLAGVRAIAACGVDRISVGALTHSAPALDLAFDAA